MTEGGGGLEKVKICVTSFMNDPLLVSLNAAFPTAPETNILILINFLCTINKLIACFIIQLPLSSIFQNTCCIKFPSQIKEFSFSSSTEKLLYFKCSSVYAALTKRASFWIMSQVFLHLFNFSVVVQTIKFSIAR